MTRLGLWTGTALLAGWSIWWLAVPRADAQAPAKVQWIWHDDQSPALDQPEGTRYFRRVFNINRPIDNPVDEGQLDITADDEFTVWINGVQVGKGTTWKRVYAFDVTKHLVHGPNVIAVEATNTSKGPAGLIVKLGYVPNGMSKFAVTSDDSWVSSTQPEMGWRELKFDAKKWSKVRILGDYGKFGPWKDIAWDSGTPHLDRFTVPPGFVVEQAARIPSDDPTFSLVNMCFDNRGRLLVSREGGGILLCTEPDKNGVLQKVVPYCTQVKNCHGMCWVKNALLLVGDGPKGTGLYRVRDTKGDDKVDVVELLHLFKGGMGEHGPHAILHGPDGWLYLVIGNHAWAKPKGVLAKNSPLLRWPQGDFGPDQGKPNTTEDVLLPRLNDSRGHAADILAPGGTIWRLDHQGKNMGLFSAGYRNHFDAAFNPAGELFTFDSDMEWDEALPWYRAVRVCHATPGSDFVWRTGAANTPDYYVDSLPPLVETGRGSPVGLEFYDHVAYPKKYQGAFFMADWAIGVIFAVHLERAGATYKGTVEKFCVGAPMNVTDCAVGPKGSLYFTMGGRGTQGSVYRIKYEKAQPYSPPKDLTLQLVTQPQPLSAKSRAFFEKVRKNDDMAQPGASTGKSLLDFALRTSNPVGQRIRALDLHNQYWAEGVQADLIHLLKDKQPEIRAHALFTLAGQLEKPMLNGMTGGEKPYEALFAAALKDPDPLVRRRACEAFIRAGTLPQVEQIWPLLGDSDRFVRHAARLVLERIDPKDWVKEIRGGNVSLNNFNAIIALGRTNQAEAHAKHIFDVLNYCSRTLGPNDPLYLEYLRTLQMALIHAKARPEELKTIAGRLSLNFPTTDWRANRELGILLVALQNDGLLSSPCQNKLLAAIEKLKPGADKGNQADRMQQIHLAYCLRLLKEGWTPANKQDLLTWYEGTRAWTGGHSFTPFLENIFRDSLAAYDHDDFKAALARGEKFPQATLVIAQKLQQARDPRLLAHLDALAARLDQVKSLHRAAELRQTLDDAVVQTALSQVTPENLPYLARGLASKNPVLRSQALSALTKLDQARPKAEDARPFRSVLLGAALLQNPKEKWQAIELLRKWSGRSFGAEEGQWEKEHKNFALWFAQTFPKEPALPNVTIGAGKSKYKMEDLVNYLDADPQAKKADVGRGRIIFEKAQCIRCHKYGKEGEGVGPDLTTLSKRFKRNDVLDSTLFPSKVISDQYRSTTIVTTSGQQITGLAARQGDTVTVLLSDATKVNLKKSDIESETASLISVMPEGLLDNLTRLEIADLLAFLESEPK